MADIASTEWRGVELSFAEQFTEKFVAAWNSHQPEMVLSLMTDDVVYDHAGWPTQMRGQADVRAFLQSTWAAFPDLTITSEGVMLDPAGASTAGYWHATGTHTGIWDPPGLKPSGRRVSFQGGAFLEFRDGKLCRYRVVYDVAELLRQLGVLPSTRSRGERLTVMAANLRNRLHRR